MDKLSAGVSDHLGLPSQSHLSVDGRLTLSCLCGDCGVLQDSAAVSPRPKELSSASSYYPVYEPARSVSESAVAIMLIYLVILDLSIPKFASAWRGRLSKDFWLISASFRRYRGMQHETGH